MGNGKDCRDLWAEVDCGQLAEDLMDNLLDDFGHWVSQMDPGVEIGHKVHFHKDWVSR